MRRVRALLHGVSICAAGFRLGLRNPGVAVLGMIPPIVVGALLIAGLVVLGLHASAIVTAWTPFAEAWPDPWPDVVRTLAGVALVAGAAVVGVLLFAGITLLVGQPFYERIWRAAERELGGIPDEVELSLRQSIAKGVDGALRLLGVALLTVLGAIGGAFVGSRALAIELSSMSADARGLSLDERRALLDTAPDVARGFGLAVYLLFLIPGGAVLGTPAATVGGMLLVRELRGEPTEVDALRQGASASPSSVPGPSASASSAAASPERPRPERP